MGGRSSSSSTTQNFTDASTVNSNQAGSVAGVVGDGNTTNVSILDGGVITKAFDFGGKSLNAVNDSVDASLNFAGDSIAANSEVLAQSFEFGTGSLDKAFEISSDIAKQSSLENRAILGAAIDASNGAQSSVLKFAKNVSTPQTQFIKAGLIGLAIFATASIFLKKA